VTVDRDHGGTLMRAHAHRRPGTSERDGRRPDPSDGARGGRALHSFNETHLRPEQ
jgi:hypothetical protein